MMQTPKVRGNSSAEAPLKVSPRATRQFKATLDTDQKSRTPKERSATVADSRSPRGSVTEIPKKSPSKVSQLESQIAVFKLDLSKAEEQLSSSEKLKEQGLREAEESQKQVSVLSLELEDLRKKFQESFLSEEVRSIDLQKISEKREQEWQAKYDALQIHHSAYFPALGSAMDEIRRLKSQLETVAQTVPMETKISEVVAVTDTNSSEAYNTLALELDESKGRIKTLEHLICELKVQLSNNEGADVELVTLKEQFRCMKSEVDLLRSAQESAEVEEQIRSTVHLNGAKEQLELVKSESIRREADMEANLEALDSQVAELEANLADKETEMTELKEIVADLKANLMDKETEFQNILEQNETLKIESKKNETEVGRAKDSAVTELNAARTAEREALMKLESLKKEADTSSKRAIRLTEQLGAAQASNAEMESELRKIKVQSDQWRKAAEVAASILSDASPGNLTERNGSLEGKFSPLANRTDCHYSKDLDEDSMKKRNGNVLKKFGLSWKKNQK